MNMIQRIAKQMKTELGYIYKIQNLATWLHWNHPLIFHTTLFIHIFIEKPLTFVSFYYLHGPVELLE